MPKEHLTVLLGASALYEGRGMIQTDGQHFGTWAARFRVGRDEILRLRPHIGEEVTVTIARGGHATALIETAPMLDGRVTLVGIGPSPYARQAPVSPSPRFARVPRPWR